MGITHDDVRFHRDLGDIDFELIAEVVPHVVWLSGPNGRIEYVNRRGLQGLAAGLEDLRGERWLDLVHRDDVERVRTVWDRAREEGTEYECAFRIRRPCGEHRWTAARAAPALAPNGAIRQWVGTLTDIDDVAVVNEVAALDAPLSARELEILRLAADGNTGPAIAAQLYLSPSTVKTHFENIYEKFGVSDRAAAVAHGFRIHLLR